MNDPSMSIASMLDSIGARPVPGSRSARRIGLCLAMIMVLMTGGAVASDQWRLVNPLPGSDDLLGGARGRDLFVFVGRAGTIVTSPDGVAWERAASGISETLNDVAWTGDAFVAVGDGGIIARSVDGANWTAGSAATAHRLAALAAGPSVVAVGEGGTVITSPDGVSWTAVDAGVTGDLADIVWTGSEFLVVGEEDAVLASPDGMVWTHRTVGFDGPFACVGSNGSVTVIATRSGPIWASGDGVEWKRATMASRLVDIVWIGDRFIAAGGGDYSAPFFSFDGVDWSYGSVTAPGVRLDAFAWDGALTVGGGVGGALAATRDGGRHFKPVNTFTGLDLYGLAVQDDLWVAAGGTPTALYGALFASADGVNWEITYDMGLEALYDVATNGSVFIAMGVINELWDGGAIVRRSTDGRTWHSTGGATGDGDWPWEWRSVSWDGVRFVAAGTGGAVATSSNSYTWHLIGGAHITDHTFFGAASDGSTLVAVGGTGVVAVSHDGEMVNVVHPGYESYDLLDAAWGNGVFVAVGTGGAVLTSVDGEQWREQSSGIDTDLHGVRFIDGEFIAVGGEGVVLVSSDGVSWQSTDSGVDGELYDVIRTDSGLTAVGSDGLVIRSGSAEPSMPPDAQFSWRPGLPEAGSPVRFTDVSAGEPTSWHWDFGDGASAVGPAATHVFAEAGAWPVSLTVGNDHGASTIETEVEVRPFCGAPPATTVTAPAAAAGGEGYEISWTETLEPGQEGIYVVDEATDLGFAAGDAAIVRGSTSTVRRHWWTEAGSFYYRVRAFNYCPDGRYDSELSEAVRVDIEPEITDLGDHVRVVTAAAHGAGLKSTEWVTDVTVHNPGPYRAPVYLYLLPRVGEGEPEGSARHWVEPDRSLLLEDAVADLASPGFGALLVASDRPLIVGSRTFNVGPNGSYGQFIAGEPDGRLSAEGGEGRLIQLSRNDDFRTNLALANADADDAELSVSVFAADGRLLGTAEASLPGLSSAFFTDVLADLAGGDVGDAFAVIEADEGTDGWSAMASLVDNRTGDPSALPALTGRLHHRIVIDDDVPVIRDEEWRDIIFAGNVYVAAGGRAIAWSEDGISWHRGDLANGAPDGQEIAWNGSRFLVAGYDGVLLSDDGRSWTRVDLPLGQRFNTVTWDGSQWVGAGSDARDWTDVGFSTDGLSWEWVRVDGIRMRDIIWAGDRFVASTDTGIATSADAVSWDIVGDVDDWVKELAWNGRELLAVGIHGIYVSTDFATFSTIDFGREPTAVVWAGDRWVVSAGGFGGAPGEVLLVSFDASTWEAVAHPGPVVNAVYGMTWDGSAVLMVDFRRRLTWLVGDGPEVTVPAVAHLGGRGGSRWRSDVELHNPGAERVDCALDLVKRGESGLEPGSVEVSVSAGGSLRMPDVVSGRFTDRGAGALTVRPADGGVVAVSSRTYSDDPAGSYGQVVAGLRAADAIHVFETGRLIQLRHSPRHADGFRTNIGLVARCPVEMEVVVDLYRGSGESIGTAAATLPAMGTQQLNDVFAPFTGQVVDDGYAVLATPTPRCSFFAFASVVDNRTNDPMLVPATVPDATAE